MTTLSDDIYDLRRTLRDIKRKLSQLKEASYEDVLNLVGHIKILVEDADDVASNMESSDVDGISAEDIQDALEDHDLTRTARAAVGAFYTMRGRIAPIDESSEDYELRQVFDNLRRECELIPASHSPFSYGTLEMFAKRSI